MEAKKAFEWRKKWPNTTQMAISCRCFVPDLAEFAVDTSRGPATGYIIGDLGLKIKVKFDSNDHLFLRFVEKVL